jgi:molybdopterin converting factor small subunit
VLTVKLGGSLAAKAGGKSEFEIEGRNVADVLRALGELCPELKPILDKGVSVSIDGTLHREALYQLLTPANEIFILPRMAGG